MFVVKSVQQKQQWHFWHSINLLGEDDDEDDVDDEEGSSGDDDDEGVEGEGMLTQCTFNKNTVWPGICPWSVRVPQATCTLYIVQPEKLTFFMQA